jgi:hypothetical protein
VRPSPTPQDFLAHPRLAPCPCLGVRVVVVVVVVVAATAGRPAVVPVSAGGPVPAPLPVPVRALLGPLAPVPPGGAAGLGCPAQGRQVQEVGVLRVLGAAGHGAAPSSGRSGRHWATGGSSRCSCRSGAGRRGRGRGGGGRCGGGLHLRPWGRPRRWGATGGGKARGPWGGPRVGLRQDPTRVRAPWAAPRPVLHRGPSGHGLHVVARGSFGASLTTNPHRGQACHARQDDATHQHAHHDARGVFRGGLPVVAGVCAPAIQGRSGWPPPGVGRHTQHTTWSGRMERGGGGTGGGRGVTEMTGNAKGGWVNGPRAAL